MPEPTPPAFKKPVNNLPKVELPKTPPAEILSKTFSMDDAPFKDEDEQALEQLSGARSTKPDNTQPSIETPKEEQIVKPETQEVENKTPEVKVEEEKKVSSVLKAPGEAKKTELITPVAKNSKIAPTNKVTRDYSGFTEEETSKLKQMSDEAYIFTSKLIHERKQNANSSFLQHPEAYTLSPEYKQKTNEIQAAAKEGQAWQQALELCKNGKPFKVPTRMDENNNIIWSNEIQPSDSAEEQLRMSMNACSSYVLRFQNELKALPDQFKNRINNDLNAINAVRAEKFAWIGDPKLLDYSVTVDGQDKTIKQIREDFKSLMPSWGQNQPMTEVASDMMVAMCILKAQLDEALASKAVVETINADTSRAEPTSRVKPQEEKPMMGGVKTFSLEGLPS